MLISENVLSTSKLEIFVTDKWKNTKKNFWNKF